MAREQTLLDRIAASARQRGGRYERTAQEDPEALMESVRRHLTHLLNARHAMSEALPEYGLPALTDVTVGTRDYVGLVRDAIRTAVERFEPRLRRVRVKVRAQAPSEMRGPAGTLFKRAGTSGYGQHFVPDQELSFDITPRNMNLGR